MNAQDPLELRRRLGVQMTRARRSARRLFAAAYIVAMASAVPFIFVLRNSLDPESGDWALDRTGRLKLDASMPWLYAIAGILAASGALFFLSRRAKNCACRLRTMIEVSATAQREDAPDRFIDLAIDRPDPRARSAARISFARRLSSGLALAACVAALTAIVPIIALLHVQSESWSNALSTCLLISGICFLCSRRLERAARRIPTY